MNSAPLALGPFPPLFGISLADQARAIAIADACHILIVEGLMSGDIALPEILREHTEDLRLKLFSKTTPPISVGVYELCNSTPLDEIISLLEDNGGYKLVVIDPEGNEIPAYTI